MDMNRVIKLFFVFSILFMASNARAVNVDLMVLYTKDFSDYNDPALYINNAIDYSNQAFANSGMDIRFRVKHYQALEIPGNTVVSSRLRNDMVDNSSVAALRNTYMPDLVVYLTRSSSKLCGIAFFPEGRIDPRNSNGFASTGTLMALKGVSVVGWDCSVDTFPHELGHNLGGGHGPVDDEVFSALDGNISYTDRDHRGIPIASSRGHGVRDVFRTIMAYPDVFGSAPVLAFHSNPRIAYNGLATGTASRDNASGMEKIARTYVSRYSMCYPTLTEMLPSPRSGGATYQACGSETRYCLVWGEAKKMHTVRGGSYYDTPCLQYNLDN